MVGAVRPRRELALRELEWEDSQKSTAEEHASNRSLCHVVILQDTSRKTVFFSSCLFSNLSDGEASFRPLDDNGDGADCVISFDKTAELWIFVSFEMRSCGFCNV